MNASSFRLRGSYTRKGGGHSREYPLRRLDGISHCVIEDPDGIRDFINTEIRKECEFDVRSLPEDDPAAGAWLRDLPKRTWTLEIVETR